MAIVNDNNYDGRTMISTVANDTMMTACYFIKEHTQKKSKGSKKKKTSTFTEHAH